MFAKKNVKPWVFYLTRSSTNICSIVLPLLLMIVF